MLLIIDTGFVVDCLLSEAWWRGVSSAFGMDCQRLTTVSKRQKNNDEMRTCFNVLE